MIFNFQPDFVGTPAPQDILFLPIQSGDQAGFKLILNVVDTPTPQSPFASHLIEFSYFPQPAPGVEIRVQDASIEATAQGAPQSSASADVSDIQEYVNSGFVGADATLDNENGSIIVDQLSDSHILPVPGLISSGSGITGAATTQIFDFSTGTASVSLTSVTFLYTSGPLLPAPNLAPLSYSTIDLPGVLATSPSSITDSGQIVGSYQDTAGHFHGYVEQSQDSFVTLDVPGAINTFAEGLTERGDVVGDFIDSTGQRHGFLERDGIFTTLDVPGSLFTAAVGINNAGQIAGEYESADQGFHGFTFDKGVFTTIDQGPLTGFFASTEAFAINGAGEVGGTFFDPDTLRSFFFKSGSFTDFDVPGQGFTILRGLNARGDSVGSYDDINFVQHGFVLSNGVFQTVDFPDGSNTSALGINSSGKIVGRYSSADGTSHSFLAVPVPGDGHDHPPQTSVSGHPGPMPSCSDPAWHFRNDELHDAGPCQMKH
ncbi:MAG TPA: hypothetical protein VFP59_19915 [Candidatus Angelobacter sp.]|nr:hypothetical protein [Candidatus Angelobacter sp.]